MSITNEETNQAAAFAEMEQVETILRATRTYFLESLDEIFGEAAQAASMPAWAAAKKAKGDREAAYLKAFNDAFHPALQEQVVKAACHAHNFGANFSTMIAEVEESGEHDHDLTHRH